MPSSSSSTLAIQLKFLQHQKSWIINNTTLICKKPNAIIINPNRLRIFSTLRSTPTCVNSFRTPIRSLLQFRSYSSSMNTPQSSGSAAQDPPPLSKTVRVVIKGRVQGVFYRNWTIENATELGLKGWVRNRRDGSVEALFSGNVDSVQEMEQRCRRGPSAAIVTGLDVFTSDEDPGTTAFERKPTA
ncbi:hypothetical protein ACFE04_026715 [Oxalis oulophora]